MTTWSWFWRVSINWNRAIVKQIQLNAQSNGISIHLFANNMWIAQSYCVQLMSAHSSWYCCKKKKKYLLLLYWNMYVVDGWILHDYHYSKQVNREELYTNVCIKHSDRRLGTHFNTFVVALVNMWPLHAFAQHEWKKKINNIIISYYIACNWRYCIWQVSS